MLSQHFPNWRRKGNANCQKKRFLTVEKTLKETLTPLFKLLISICVKYLTSSHQWDWGSQAIPTCLLSLLFSLLTIRGKKKFLNCVCDLYFLNSIDFIMRDVSIYKYFYIYLFWEKERDREREREREIEWGREKKGTGNLKQAPSRQQRAQCGIQTHEPWVHNLSQNLTLNRLSPTKVPLDVSI